MIKILSTKRLLPSQKQVVLDANIDLTDEDFIETNIKNFELSKVYNNLIFTSQNAVQSILQHPKCEDLKSKDVFSIGMKTKDLLTENGFNVVAYTGYAADLAEIISLIYSEETFTFFSGNLRRDVLPNTLQENGIAFNEIEVYETQLKPHKIKETVDAILFFSPSGVESYLKDNPIKKELCFCIGETTAEALENNHIKNIIIAEHPSVENVITEVKEYYYN